LLLWFIWLQSKPEESKAAPVKAAVAPPPPPTPAPVAVAPPPAAAVDSSAAAPISSVTVSLVSIMLHSMKVLCAEKLKLEYGAVSAEKSVKALSAGKSALQNEILGIYAFPVCACSKPQN
jgi:3-oxoacyl-ACP reductase-like protein